MNVRQEVLDLVNLGFHTMLEMAIVMMKITMPFVDSMVEIAAQEMVQRKVGTISAMIVNAFKSRV